MFIRTFLLILLLVQDGYESADHHCHYHCFGDSDFRRHFQQVPLALVRLPRAFYSGRFAFLSLNSPALVRDIVLRFCLRAAPPFPPGPLYDIAFDELMGPDCLQDLWSHSMLALSNPTGDKRMLD